MRLLINIIPLVVLIIYLESVLSSRQLLDDENYYDQDEYDEIRNNYGSENYLDDEISSEEPTKHGINYAEVLWKLQQIRKTLTDNIQLLIKPIVYKIHNEESTDAAHLTDQIDSEDILVQIVQSAYTFECDLEELKIQSNILHYLRLLFKTSFMKIGFDELLKQVELRGETLKSPKLCLMSKRLEGPLNGIDKDTLSDTEINEMDSSLKSLIEKAKLKAKCRRSKKINDYETQFGQKHYSKKDQEEDDEEVEDNEGIESEGKGKKPDKNELIKKEIDNLFKGDIKNFDNAMNHINTIKNPEKAINSTVALLNEMKQHQHLDTNELIQLASNLKTESDKKGKQLNNTFIKNVPSIVQELLWKGNLNATNCWLKNKNYEKYLQPDKNITELGFRSILLVNKDEINSYGNWHFESKQIKNSIVFRIFNTRFNEYLYNTEPSSEIFTKSGDCTTDDCNWQVIPAENATYLQIKSKATNAYLSIEDGHVVTKISDSINNDIKSATFWDLECKNNRERVESVYNGSKSNINQAVKFVESIQDPTEKIEAMEEVLKKMKENNHSSTSEFVQIAQMIKLEMEGNNNDNETVNALLREVPEQLQELLWKGNKTNCWLKNRGTQEYFYVNETQNDKNQRPVYGRPANQADSSANWNFITKTNEKDIYFQIYSTKFNETFFTSVNQSQVIFFTEQKDCINDDCLWQVVPVEDAKYIQILSKATHEILALAEQPSNIGNVKLMKTGDLRDNNIKNSHWTLACRNDSERILDLYAANDNHVENVITFVKSLQSEDLYEGIATIQKELKHQNKTVDTGLIQLAQFIKDATNNPALMENLKETFPVTVRELIWNGQNTNCWLNNKAYNEFLYIPQDDDKPRQLFSMISENMDSFGNWLFLPKAGSSAFHILNPRLNESIESTNNASTAKSIHTIPTSECQNNCEWIVAAAYGGEYIQIKSISNDELLYVDSEQVDDKRRVYTVDPKNISASDIERTLWTLKCRNDSERTHELYGANSSNVEKALVFLRSLEGHKDVVQNTDKLIKEMIRLQHVDTSAFVQVAFFVKTVVNEKQEDIDLRSYFSPIIQELIWKGSEINCWIKSKIKDEYFYIADKYNDKGRYVFTWIPGDMGTEGNWLFKPNQHASAFRIRNSLYNEDLHPLEQRSSKEAIRMVTTYVSNSCGNKCDWEIIPAEDATYIQIRNGNHNEYLVADDAYFEGSRSIFTIPLESVNSTNQTFWTITCQTDAERIQSTYNSDLTNFNKSFAYVQSLQDVTKTYDGITEILEAMKNNSHLDTIQLIRLANFAKQQMEATGFNETIQKQFPKIIRDIIWMKNDSFCWIISEESRLKLFHKGKESDEKLVMASAKEFKDGGMNWKFIAQDKNGGFMLQNARSNQFLYRSKSEGKTRIFLKDKELCGYECQWRTVPAEDAQFIQIMTPITQELLILDDTESHGTRNLTTVAKTNMTQEKELNTYWNLDCKNDKNRIASLYDGLKGDFTATFNYIKSLGKPEDIMTGIQQLVKLMEEYDRTNSNEMLQLAFYAKDFGKNVTLDLKSLFPVMVQNLVWADPHLSCWLTNEATNSYLSSEHTVNEKNQRISFSVTFDFVDSLASWILIPQNGGESYRIYNAGSNEHLQSLNDGANQQIFTYKNDACQDECLWKIIPVDNQHVQISFRKTKEILLARPLLDNQSSIHNSNLKLVAESSVASEYDNTLWALDCQNDINRIPKLYDGAIKNFNKSMKFIKSLSEPQSRVATISLMNEMKNYQQQNSSEFIALALFMKNQLKVNLNDSLSEKIPAIVKDLIWKEENLTCWIQNEMNEKYLMVSDEQIGVKNRKVVVKNFDEIRSTASWEIRFEQEGVRLRNSLFFGDMAVSKDTNDLPFTTIDRLCMENCIWELIPNSNGKSLQIRHKSLQKYLQVSDANLQPILTSLTSPELNANATNWKIRCQNETARVHLIYNNSITSFNKTLDYIKSINRFNQTVLATQLLLNEMASNNHVDSKELIQLAYFVKQALDINGTSSLKLQFPHIIQDLIWKCDTHECRLRSEYSKEYLYSAYSKTNRTRRHVYTWIPGNKDIQCNFAFEPQHNASMFTIKSLHFDEYIFSFNGKSEDEDRRPIFSWIPGNYDEQAMWEIYPVNNGTLIQVKNKLVGEFLYADEPQDEERRKVVTWSGAPLIGNQTRTLWSLDTD